MAPNRYQVLIARWLLLAAFLFALPAQASNAINGITMKFWRCANSIAVQAVVTGDDDTNSVTRVWQRYVAASPAAYDTGMVMIRRPGTHVYEARILYLPEGKTAQFFCKAEDGGTPQQTAADTASCSRYRLPATSGTQYYVNGSTGNNSWDGLSPTFVSGTNGPKLTIVSANAKLTSDNAPTGSVINVAIGEYHEQVVLTGSTDGREYTLLGASRDSTIICGANENVEAGRRDGSNAIAWTHLVTNADAVAQTELAADSVYICTYPASGGPADSTQLIILGYGEYIQRKTSLWGMLLDSTGTVNCGASPPANNIGERSGWYWSGDTLYVKRSNGQAPPVSGNHFGYRDVPLKVSHRNWTIRNLTVRYAGQSRNDNLNTDATYKTTAALPSVSYNPNPGVNGRCIQVAGVGVNASGTRVIGCNVYGSAGPLIYDPIFASNGRGDSLLVAGCMLSQFNLVDMDYSAQKCRAEEGMLGVDTRGTFSNVFGNTITGSKGILQGASILPSVDSTNGSWSEYSSNTVRVIDDGIEVDNAPDINVLVYGNQVRKSVSGFSCITGYVGPVFVFFNALYAKTNGVKMGGGNLATYNIYNNTILTDPVLNSTGFRAASCVGGFANHYYFRNNIFGTNSAPTFNVQGVGVGGGPPVDSTGWRTNEFNYDAYQMASGGTNAAQWVGVNRTVATLQSALTLEKNGKEIVGALNLLNQSSFNIRLLSTSGAVDAGMRISGVNAAFGINRYKTLPDLGAAPELTGCAACATCGP